MNIDDLFDKAKQKPLLVGLPAFLLLTAVAVPLLGIQGPASIASSTLCAEAVSESYVDSNAGSQYEDNTAFIVSTTTNGCGDQIIGGGIEIPESELQDGDTKAESGFTAQLSGYNAFFEQSVNQENTNWQIQFNSLDCGIYCGSNNRDTMSEWQANGDSNQYQYQVVRKINGNPTLFGTRVIEQGDTMQFSPATETGFSADLQLCSSGRCDTQTITEDKPTVSFNALGGLNAEATHTGSLVGEIRNIDYSGTVTPVQAQGGQLFLTSPDVVTSYETTLDSLDTCLENNADGGERNLRVACGNDDELQNMYTNQEDLVEDTLPFNADVSIQNGDVRTSTRDPNTIETQSIRWTIGAEWIGIFTEKPDPSIGNANDIEVGQNSRAYVTVPVTNQGSSGDINVNVQCGGPLTGGSQQLYVQEGSTTDFNIEVSSGSGTATGYSCTATATSVADASLSDSTSFTSTLTEDRDPNPPEPPEPDPCEVNPDLPECEEDGLPIVPIAAGLTGIGVLAGAWIYRGRIAKVVT